MAIKLQNIIEAAGAAEVLGDADREVTSLAFDSRAVAPGGVFFAVRGTVSDGHDHIPQAVANGAAAVVCERVPEPAATNSVCGTGSEPAVRAEWSAEGCAAAGAEGRERNSEDSDPLEVNGATPDPSVTYIVVEDSAKALGLAASAFHDHPSRKLRLVGVTGTNGKTTTATLLSDLFGRLGYKAGLISTVEYRTGSRTIDSTHTTPDPIRLNEMLAEMADAGCEYCFMEVSSHSLVQERTAGLQFAGGVFSNITHDHLDYHGTFAEYIKAKKLFFDALPSGAFALTNGDDRNGEVMLQNTRAKKYTYSLRKKADFNCKIIETHFDGTLLNIDGSEMWTGFVGRFNAYNLLAVYAVARLLGADKGEVLQAMSGLGAVNGRFEVIRSAGGVTAIVDYAHTPDALQNVLNTINDIRTPDRKLYTLVGCGGNRDAAKRPVMASIAAGQSDLTILTSDNPRHEEPEAIIADMEKGLDPTSRHLSITGRREAIRTAAAMARPGDIILIAGKGHETYQDVKGVKSHFDDREEVREAFGIFAANNGNPT